MAEQEAFNEQLERFPIGERLRETRETRGLSLEDLASQTRIPIRHLQHIEREEWDALPAATYSVGFVRAYANSIGLDGDAMARDLRERLGGMRSRAPVAEYYQPADPARVPPRSLALVAAVVAIVFVVGYAIWRSSLGDDESGAGITVPVPESAPSQPGPQAPQPAQPQALAGQPVTLVATDEVWVRIEDGGASLFEGIMAPGQRFTVPPTAQAPVIRTGRPQVLRAMVGTRDFGPLEPVERTVSDVSLRAEDLAARLQPGATPADPVPPPRATPIPPQ